MEEKQYFKIGEIASLFSVSVKAIRIYEKKGIIWPAAIDPLSGYRLYDQQQIQQVGALLEFKSLGFSLAEIRSILCYGASDEQLENELLRKRISWQDAVCSNNEKASSVDKIVKRIEEADGCKELTEMSEEQRAWLLVKWVCDNGFKGDKELSEALWL